MDIFCRLAHRCGEIVGEFDEYDIYKSVAANKGKERPLFKLICLNESVRKLNSCGGGMEKALDPETWKSGKGSGYTVEDVDEDEDGEDEHDEL